MSEIEVRVPEGVTADDDEEIVMATWLVDDGEQVDEGDTICELMVTKATVEVPSPATGTLSHKAAVEDIVAAGAVIGSIKSA